MNTNDFVKSFRHDAAGGAATTARAISTFKNLQSFAKQSRWSDVRPETLTPKQVRLYVENRMSSGTAARTVANEVSHLRRSVRGCGRDLGDIKDKKNGWSSERLSVQPSSRIGGKSAVSREFFEEAREKVEPNIRVCMDLQAELGFRMQEAVKCKDAEHWAKTLEVAREKGRGAELHLSSGSGTKGDRERFVYVPAGRVEMVLEIVERVLDIKEENGGCLIAGGRDLHQAKDHYVYILRTVGLSGESSSHGLRRLYAHDQRDSYREEGLDEKALLCNLSNDLGHGSGRGRWISNNYLLGGRG